MTYIIRRNKIEARLTVACVAMALMMGACTENVTDEAPADGKMLVTAEAALPRNGAQTRTDYTDDMSATDNRGMTVAWAEGDAFTVWKGNTNGQIFTLDNTDTEGTGHFTGSLAASAGSATLYALYPSSATAGNSTVSGIYLDISAQTQSGDASTAHLAANDFMRSTATWDGTESSVAFADFTHLMAVLRLDITLPGDNDGIRKITLSGLDSGRTLDLTKDPATDSEGFWADSNLDDITLTPTDGTPTADTKQYTAYLMVFPATAMKELTVKVTLTTGAIYAKTYTNNNGFTLESGKRYWLTVKDLGSVSGGSTDEDMGGGGSTGGIGGM